MNYLTVKYNKNYRRVVVLGCSASGKTTYIKDYAEEYYEAFGRSIYVISPSSEYDDIKYITKIQMTEDIIDKIRIIDLENSLVIIDDIILSNSKYKNILSIVYDIFSIGRHHNVSCIISVNSRTLYDGIYPFERLSEIDDCMVLPEQRRPLRHMNNAVDN